MESESEFGQEQTMESFVPDSAVESGLELSPVHKVVHNKLLLDRIFERVEDPSVELRICRSVSKEWKCRATPCLRENNWTKRNFLVLKDVDELKKYTSTLNPSIPWPCDSDSEFIKYGRLALESFPIGLDEAHLFQCYEINLDIKINPEISRIFFNLFPQSVKSLNLTMPLRMGLYKSGDLDNILASQSDSLRELRLRVLVSDEDAKLLAKKTEPNSLEPSTACLNADEEIKLISLDYLCLEFGYADEWPEIRGGDAKKLLNKFLENVLNKIPQDKPVRLCLLNWPNVVRTGTIDLLKKYDQVNNLKVLSLMGSVKAGQLRSLEESGVELQILNSFGRGMSTEFTETHPQFVTNFLATQVNTLEQLDWYCDARFKFPAKPMVNLKKLHLVNFTAGQESPDQILWNEGCPPIFYDSFPKLEELHFSPLGLEQEEKFYLWFLPPQLPCTSVKKFGIFYDNLNARILESISNTFPHLKTLKIGDFQIETKVDKVNFFHTLWNASFSSTMEEFSITLSNGKEHGVGLYPGKQDFLPWRKYELDSLFSGIEEEIISQGAESGDYVSFHNNDANNNSILSFKNIRSLVIKNDGYGVFTNFSAYCIFGKLTKLESLHLSKGMWEFSKSATDYLQRKLRAASPIHIHASSAKRLEHFLSTNFETFRRFPEVWESDESETLCFHDLDLDNSAKA